MLLYFSKFCFFGLYSRFFSWCLFRLLTSFSLTVPKRYTLKHTHWVLSIISFFTFRVSICCFQISFALLEALFQFSAKIFKLVFYLLEHSKPSYIKLVLNYQGGLLVWYFLVPLLPLSLLVFDYELHILFANFLVEVTGDLREQTHILTKRLHFRSSWPSTWLLLMVCFSCLDADDITPVQTTEGEGHWARPKTCHCLQSSFRSPMASLRLYSNGADLKGGT